MTCIIGLVEDKTIYFGSDTLSVSGGEAFRANKIFVKDEVMYGISGSHRLHQIIEYQFKRPEFLGGGIAHYIMTEYLYVLQKCIKNNDHIVDNDDTKGFGDSQILIGFKGFIYTIWRNFQIDEAGDHYMGIRNYASIGCGGMVARAALKALDDNVRLEAHGRIKKALQITSELMTSVGGPFEYLTMEMEVD